MKISIEERNRLRELFKKYQDAPANEKAVLFDSWNEAITKAKGLAKEKKKPIKKDK